MLGLFRRTVGNTVFCVVSVLIATALIFTAIALAERIGQAFDNLSGEKIERKCPKVGKCYGTRR